MNVSTYHTDAGLDFGHVRGIREHDGHEHGIRLLVRAVHGDAKRKLPPQFNMCNTDVLMSSNLDPVGKGSLRLMCPPRLAKLQNMLVVTLRTTDHYILVTPTELVGQRNRREQLVATRLVSAPHNTRELSSWLNTTLCCYCSQSFLMSSNGCVGHVIWDFFLPLRRTYPLTRLDRNTARSPSCRPPWCATPFNSNWIFAPHE